MTTRRSIFHTLAIGALLAVHAAAQIAGTGSIQGVVTDPTGAVIPAATVSAVNIATGAVSERQTTAAGFYVLTPLPAGRYKLTVTASGFQTLVQETILVDALTVVPFDVSMKIGSTAETVT